MKHIFYFIVVCLAVLSARAEQPFMRQCDQFQRIAQTLYLSEHKITDFTFVTDKQGKRFALVQFENPYTLDVYSLEWIQNPKLDFYKNSRFDLSPDSGLDRSVMRERAALHIPTGIVYYLDPQATCSGLELLPILIQLLSDRVMF